MDMTRSERAEFYNRNHWRMPKDVPFCINCEHFYQHYIKGGPPIFTISMVPLDCGHCAFPRMKERKAYDICDRFKNRYAPVPAVTGTRASRKEVETSATI